MNYLFMAFVGVIGFAFFFFDYLDTRQESTAWVAMGSLVVGLFSLCMWFYGLIGG